MKKILITGSNGFLGRLAKEYFIKNYELVFVDISSSTDANFYKVDIGNFVDIDNVITKEKPNIIFHFASEIFDTHNKKKIYKTNVEGSNNIKKSAIKNNVEISNIIKSHIFDGIAVTKFLYWIKKCRKNITELEAEKKLEYFKNLL